MTQEERLKELLLGVATQLDKWAAESAYGGWSTHQVKPMRKLAGEIRCEVWGHPVFDRLLGLRAKPIRGLRRGEIVHTVGDMKVGEWGYITFGAVDENGLDKSHPVLHTPTETADLSIVRIDVGWVIGGKVFHKTK